MSDINTVSKTTTSAKDWSAPKLSVVVPTFNERDNVVPLFEKLSKLFGDMPWEMIVVDDDSPDGTADTVKTLAKSHPNVRCIHRVGRRGLSSACIEGISASLAPYAAVMDADHQHDESILPKMLMAAEEGADLVVGSRYTDLGSAGEGFSSIRLWGSRLATWMGSVVAGSKTTDPMSGFFLLRRDLFDAVAAKLSPEGFKILLDIIVTARGVNKDIKVAEVPYDFRQRLAGESKMSALVVVQFFGLFVSKLSFGLIPATFMLFSMVGLSGVVVHLAVLNLAHFYSGFNFINAQLAATAVAMTWNYFLNNSLTYAHQQLRGTKLWWGLLSFYAICSLGALANISVAAVVYNMGPGANVAALAGIVISSIFNYAVTRLFTWRR